MVNRAGNLVGIMPRRFIKILLKKREFTSGSAVGNASTQGMASARAVMFFSGQREGQNTYRSGFGYTQTPIIDEEEHSEELLQAEPSRVHFERDRREPRASFGNYSLNNDNMLPDDNTSQDGQSTNGNAQTTLRNRNGGHGFSNALRQHDWTHDQADLAGRSHLGCQAFGETPRRSTLTWRDFTISSGKEELKRDMEEIEEICKSNFMKFINLAPYMIETPFVVQSTDKL